LTNNDLKSGSEQTDMVERGPEWSSDLEAILKAYELAGGRPDVLQSQRVASAVVSGNRVLGVNRIAGVAIEADATKTGVRARIRVSPGTKIEYPVHLCFGMTEHEGLQEIDADFDIGDGAEVGFLAHCTFPNAVDLRHVMSARIRVGSGAVMRYSEAHYHGADGGIEVLPATTAQVEEGGRLETEFSLVQGRIGRLEIRYEADVLDRGVVELITKAFGSGDDRVSVNEVVRLNGEGARGLTKTRVAVRDTATSEIYTRAEGNAPNCIGHMDCTEVVQGDATASNTPVVLVRKDTARVTHEAAIGSVGKKELETLMSRGLGEDEAIDIIIRGMLK
jgi:Fe-S cluster assembly scaffold protein SufB